MTDKTQTQGKGVVEGVSDLAGAYGEKAKQQADILYNQASSTAADATNKAGEATNTSADQASAQGKTLYEQAAGVAANTLNTVSKLASGTSGWIPAKRTC